MNSGMPFAQLRSAETIPQESIFPMSMGDGTGTKKVTKEILVKEMRESLKVGNLEELQTENKESLVGAINEVKQSGGGGASIDVLDSKEEIEANTQEGKSAGALALKEMFGSLNDKLSGCSLEQDGEDFYIVGADSVRKKLGSKGTVKRTQIFSGKSNSAHTVDVSKYEGYESFTINNFAISSVSVTEAVGAVKSKNVQILNRYDANAGKLYLSASGTYSGDYGMFAVYTVDLIVPS